MPWAKHHRKEKFAALDKRRRPKRRAYFRAYWKKYYSLPGVRDKELIRKATRRKYGVAKKCEVCGSTNKVTYHHYTEPYEVDKFMELCEYHHMLLDYAHRYKKDKEVNK